MEIFEQNDGKEIWLKKNSEGLVIGYEVYFPSPIPAGDLLNLSASTQMSVNDARKRAEMIKEMLLKKQRNER